MTTLLLRLAGPMQSWGIDSKVDVRSASAHPSKSGVIGMIAAAMGRSREDPLDDLRSLRFGVRVDQPGTLLRDYHTVHHQEIEKRTYITERYYLEDALFLVGLEGDDGLLEAVDRALRNPYYPLFLGRRSCPATGRLSLGNRGVPLEEALRDEPWLASSWYMRRHPDVELEITMDSDGPDGYMIRDEPLSFSQKRREYGFRKVETSGVPKNRSAPCRERETDHDALKDLEVLRCTYLVWS